MEPTTVEDVVAAIAEARATGTALEVRGGGSILGRLSRGDEPVLSTTGLTGVVAHDAENLTVTVRAGTPLAEFDAVLASAGQECPIEPSAEAGSTVGGRVATALAGPRQLSAGRVRDWVLRVRFVTGAGQAAMAGGVTVKDVTGYDLCRLLTGSWGTIGVLTELTLKVRPIPPHRAWYVTEASRDDLDDVLYRPAALVSTRARTHVLLEGHPDDATAQATAAGLRPGEAPGLPSGARVSVDPARLGDLKSRLSALDVAWAAQDGVGVCHVEGGAAAVAEVRRVATSLGGTALVLDPSLGLPAFGPRPETGPIEERVLLALDPDRVLAPWRWSR